MQSALVPLLFRLNDQLPSVAKVWISRLTPGMGRTDTSQGSQGLGQGLLAVGRAPPVQPLGRIPAEPAQAGVDKVARPCSTPALPAPARLGSSLWPLRQHLRPEHVCSQKPRGFSASPQVSEARAPSLSQSPRAIPKRLQGIWARRSHSFLRAGSQQE